MREKSIEKQLKSVAADGRNHMNSIAFEGHGMQPHTENPILAGVLTDDHCSVCQLETLIAETFRKALRYTNLTHPLCVYRDCSSAEVVDELLFMLKEKLFRNDSMWLKHFACKDPKEFSRWMLKTAVGECHHLYDSSKRNYDRLQRIPEEQSVSDSEEQDGPGRSAAAADFAYAVLPEKDAMFRYWLHHLDRIVEEVLEGDCLRVVQAVVDPELRDLKQEEKAIRLGMNHIRFNNLYTKAKGQLREYLKTVNAEAEYVETRRATSLPGASESAATLDTVA